MGRENERDASILERQKPAPCYTGGPAPEAACCQTAETAEVHKYSEQVHHTKKCLLLIVRVCFSWCNKRSARSFNIAQPALESD